MKRWRLQFDGFGDVVIEADTASKAKWRAFVQAQDAGWFRDRRDGFIKFAAWVFPKKRGE
jgi:hypothetical protein